MDLDEFPALKRWHDIIKQRDGVQRGIKVPTSKTDAEVAARYHGMREKMRKLAAGL